MKYFLVLCLVLSSTAFTGIDNAVGESQDKIRSAIEAANSEWVKQFNAGSAAGVTALYTDDAKLLPPNSDFVSGREAMTGVWQAMLDSGVKGGKLNTMEVTGMGDSAVEVGTYELWGDGNKGIDKGKYIVFWKKSGSGWKLYRDIWNSSMPAAGSGSR